MSEPFTLKYQLIWLREDPSQSSDGVTPDADFSAEVMADRVYVLLVLGVMPAAASQSYVGRVYILVQARLCMTSQ